ncbi:hypothetical protein Pcac1_g24959 [Phytophthora cactorum]|nr:hypothetical protein Pcac1_g24959 [Phytophthora cactorum]KAG2969401.1 hypothetical protein PC119_g23925 [Phytophthora cactorum]KAG3134515.1 hypothetical protein C6341_g22129 [Phytophthora cactorum]KAG4043649.1 hypothetical protein PC123_g20880 [Phytophthora cactorum]
MPECVASAGHEEVAHSVHKRIKRGIKQHEVGVWSIVIWQLGSVESLFFILPQLE